MKVDFARLNHILIPKGKEGRDRFRASRFGRIIVPLVGIFWGSLTDEGRTLVFVTLLVGAFAIDVQRSNAYVLFSVLAGLLAASVVTARRLRLVDVTVTVGAPRRVTVGEPVTFTITCQRGAALEGGRARHPVRVRGPFLPWDGAWLTRRPPKSSSPATAARTPRCARASCIAASTISTRSPRRRSRRRASPADRGSQRSGEAPRRTAHRERTNLPGALARKHQQGGVALASRSGEAMDLLGIKPYRPGDPVRDLHARSWARTGIPVVREYQQEHLTRVGVVLDTDVADPDRLERRSSWVAGIIAHLSRSDTLVDVLAVGDRVHELTAGRGTAYLDQALDLLAIAERGTTLDAASLVRRLGPHLEQLSSVIIVTADDAAERTTLREAILGRGLSCSTIVVDDALHRSIIAKEALAW